MKKYKIFLILGISFLLVSCATTPQTPLPDKVLNARPDVDCQDLAKPGGWSIRAELFESTETNYLVLFFDPGFQNIREPTIDMKVGHAIYQGHDGPYYYYRISTLPKINVIGRILFQTKSPSRVYAGGDIQQIRMERKEGSNCLKLFSEK